MLLLLLFVRYLRLINYNLIEHEALIGLWQQVLIYHNQTSIAK